MIYITKSQISPFLVTNITFSAVKKTVITQKTYVNAMIYINNVTNVTFCVVKRKDMSSKSSGISGPDTSPFFVDVCI